MSSDRRGWLIFFGIVQLGIGLICLVLMLATAVSRSANAGQALLFDALAAFYFLVVGVGSMRARRWAQAIALAVSAVWLICGVIAFAALFVVMPHVLVIVPPSQEHSFIVGSATSVFVAMILVPLILVLFYRAPSVRATCEARDTTPRWTDRVPLPVLALSLTIAFGALTLVANVNAKATFLFGVMVTGATASVSIVAMALLFAVIAVQLFRMRESAWWVLLLMHLAAAGGMLLVLTRGFNINGYYARLGALTPQIRAMHFETLATDPKLWAIILTGWIAYLLFLIWLRRRYFTFSG